MKKPCVSVMIGIEANDELKLNVKLIQLVDGEPGIGEYSQFVFRWFTMHGNTQEGARENCLESLAFYLRCSDPGLRDSVLNALEPAAARDVRARLGLPREEEKAT